MRYIADSNSYIKEVSFGATIVCGWRTCVEYTGEIPSGYDSLEDWFAKECESLYRWRVVDGNLTIDPNAEEPAQCEPFGIVTLWRNKNPTSTFDSQTVALDLSRYDHVSIYYKNTQNGTAYLSSGIFPKGSRITMQYVSTSGVMYHRHADVSENGVEFGAGQKNGEASDSAPVPMIIYGWKGIGEIGVAKIASAICGEFLCGQMVCG